MMKCLSAPSADDDNRDDRASAFLADYNYDDNCKDPIEFSSADRISGICLTFRYFAYLQEILPKKYTNPLPY